MNPTHESPLWDEIKRLRRDLTDLSDRHHAEFMRISIRIADLESQLGKADAQAATPPPLPKLVIPEKRPVLMPALAEASLKPEPKPGLAPEPIPEPSPPPSIPPSPAPLPDNTFELDFGKVWFVRIGIVILLTGLVFLGNYAYQNWIREMPNGARLAALFACALALVETGRRLANKESLHRFGEVLLAGGMAFFYYCIFAAHHVARLRVIESPALGAVLLSAAALAIAAVSWLRQAKATAVLGILLASYATMLQPIGWMSCLSNLLLGGLGLFFMLRPGWSGPGWVSMLGTYGAFLGWQLFGASGENVRTDDPATLWFLPPVWAMFAIPGAVNRFRESLSERARAWFTASNNALFFLLFSGVWLHQNGSDGYWKVAAVFGTVLIALGILGRRQNATAGGVNIGQGLAVVTLAIILKLEGHHLALALAFESLSLAIAALRFRGKCETVFSLLAGLGSGALVAHQALSLGMQAPPVWSLFLAASLLAASAFVTDRIKSTHETFAHYLRTSTALLFVVAVLVAAYLCLIRLGEASGIAVASVLCAALAVGTLRLDPARRLPEIMWAALLFLGIAVYRIFPEPSAWPMALAIESLALALVAWKYRARTETVFALLAGCLSARFIGADAFATDIANRIPIWSAAMMAGFITASSIVTTRVKTADENFTPFIRFAGVLLFAIPAAIVSDLCLHRLESPASILTAILLSGALSFASLKLDTQRLQPEIPWASLWFLVLAGYLGFIEMAMWPLALATAVSLAGTWLWHRPAEADGPPHDLAANRAIPAYAFSLATPFFLWLICADFIQLPALLSNQVAAFLLVPVSLLLSSPRLAKAAAIYSLITLSYLLFSPAETALVIFASTGFALASAAVLISPWAKFQSQGVRDTTSIFRLSAFVSYCVAWHTFAPGAWTDFLAITSLILTAVSVFMKRKMFVECLGFIAIALLGLAFEMLTSPWMRIEDAGTWRGISVVVAMLALIFTYRQRPALITDPQVRKTAIAALAGITCLTATLWATQMLVWRFGWKPTAVLWTILGFAFVSAGLWQRFHIFRVCGFGLLILSFCKLFASDVWDFTAFMRVVSFIVLGAALILLGLFYNKFAEAIKALLDDERGINREEEL
ncbi:MAG: DUF2339 domain-containing protein [Akkermansiaceae bacterium]